jgi:hypothetical protein
MGLGGGEGGTNRENEKDPEEDWSVRKECMKKRNRMALAEMSGR